MSNLDEVSSIWKGETTSSLKMDHRGFGTSPSLIYSHMGIAIQVNMHDIFAIDREMVKVWETPSSWTTGY